MSDGNTENTQESQVSSETSQETSQPSESKMSLFNRSPEAFLAKQQGVDLNSKESGETEAKPEKEEGKGQAPKEKPKPEINPEIKKFAEEKKLDLEKLYEPENVHKIIDMARNSEVKMQETLRERDLRDQKLKEAKAKQDADETLKAAQPPAPKKIEDMSPTEKIEANIQQSFDAVLKLAGCANEEELLKKYPEVHARFAAEANALEKQAWKDELEWRDKQRDKQTKEAESKERIQKEWDGVRATAQANIDTAKKEDPQIVETFKTSGLNDLLDEMAKVSNVPVEYWVANKKFFTTFSKMAKAMLEVQKLPERDKKIKQEVEKGIHKAKTAEMPASSERLPSDHKIVHKKSGISLID